MAGPELDAEYWAKNMRQSVLFADGVASLAEAGADIYLEVGPHPVLANSIQQCLAGDVDSREKPPAVTLSSLQRRRPERAAMLGSLGKLYTMGYQVDWRAISAAHKSPRYVHLPNYTWRRETFWNESNESLQARVGPGPPPFARRATPDSLF